MINDGKVNVMPAQAKLLTPEQIHVLAAYVWQPVAQARAARGQPMSARQPVTQRRTARRRTPPPRLVSLYQKQQKIYARAVSGWFAGWRWALVWATQLLFYGLPWLQWNERQAVLFDLARAALLHLRPGAVPAGLHLPDGRC